MEKEYFIYVSVIFDNITSKKSYYYISKFEEIKVGDRVLVNCVGDKITGKVVKVEKFTKEQVPFPIYKTKKILKIIYDNTKQESNKIMKNEEKNYKREDSFINKTSNDIYKIYEKNSIINQYSNVKYEKEEGKTNYSDGEQNQNNSKLYMIVANLLVCCIALFFIFYKDTTTFDKNIISNTNNYYNITSNNSSSYKSSSTSPSSNSSYSSSYSYNYENNSDITTTGQDYVRKVGVNGAITYSCIRYCSSSCKSCKSCLTNRKSFPSSHCNFSYQYSKGKDRGWFGCPQCGDISYADFYEKAYDQ